MRLEKASYKAVKYACLKFHYAETVPVTNISYSVFNNKNEWCGVICYGLGANYLLGKTYGVVSGQFLELTRMALNGKQESTSKAMAISIKLLKKHKPLVKILISYADKDSDNVADDPDFFTTIVDPTVSVISKLVFFERTTDFDNLERFIPLASGTVNTLYATLVLTEAAYHYRY